MASFLPPAIFEIKAIADEAIAKFGDVNKELAKMEGQAEKAGDKVGGMEKASRVATAGLLAMGAAFAGFAAVGIKEAMEAENAMIKLGSTMSALGINTEKNREKFKNLADSYVDLGFAGDSAIVGFERLLRVTGNVEQAQKLLALSADLARTKNMSLEEAAGALARASMGNARAFKEMGITLDTTLPKSEAVAKAMDELNARIGTQAENATKTFAVQLQIVKERFNDTAESLGSVLLPILKDLLVNLNKAIDFVKRNAEVFKIIGGVILTVTVALASYNAVVKTQTAITRTYAVVKGFAAGVVALFTKQQQAANTAMKANPIGLVVSAVMLLAGAFVMLWNRSETFRKAVIAVGKAGLMAFSSVIPILGKVGEAILKVVLTPLKTMLTVLSKLPGVGKFAKSGLDLLNKGLDGVSDFADKASAKAKQLAANLDKLNKPIKIGGGKGIEIPDMGNTGVVTGLGGLDPKEKAKVQKANEDAQKLIKDTQEKIGKAQAKFAETKAKIEKEYNEKVTKLQADAADKIAKLNKDAEDKRVKLKADAAEKILKLENEAKNKVAELEKRGSEQRQEISKRFNDQVADFTKKKNAALEKLTQDNQARIADITRDGANKLADIVKQSMDRLRSAFATGAAFSLGDSFKSLLDGGKATADELVKTMRERLAGIRKLAENASKLAGVGFSQTFIEQVVAQGSDVGNKLAETILTASPETQKEMRGLFGNIEETADSGLDALAVTMNTGAQLATKALTQAYADAQKETADALKRQGADYLAAQAEINKEFNESLAEAERVRDEAIANSLKEQEEAIAEVKKNLTEATAEVRRELTEALLEIDKELQERTAEINADLAQALAEAHKEMSEAMEAARKELADELAEIEKNFKEKMGEIEKVTKKVADQVAALIKKIAEMRTEAAKPIVIPAPVFTAGGGGGGSGGGGTSSKTTTAITNNNTNVSVTGMNLTSPQQTASDIVSTIKFGNTIVPTAPTALAAKESGAIGAASIAARTTTVATPTPLSAAKMGQLNRMAL